MNIKNIINNSFLLVISTAIGLIIGEYAIRKFELSKTWSSYVTHRNAPNISDDIIGYTRIPNDTLHSIRNTLIISNSEGFRDNTPKKNQKSNKKIAFIGDSVTEGLGVDENKRFSNYSKTEFYNYAVTGYCTIDQIKILEEFIIKKKPSDLFLQICFNDFKSNIVKDSIFKISNTNTRSSLKIKNDKVSKNKFTFKSILTKSALYLFFAEKYNFYRYRNNKPNELLPNKNQIKNNEIKLFTSKLKRIKKICDLHEINFHCSYFPLNVEVIIKSDSLSEYTNDLIYQICNNNKINYLSVLEKLRHETNPDEFYIDDCHLSEKGHLFVSKLINDYFN